MAERLPPGVYDPESMKPAYLPNGLESNGIRYLDTNGEHHIRSDSVSSSTLIFPTGVDSLTDNGSGLFSQLLREPSGVDGRDDRPDVRLQNGDGPAQSVSSRVSDSGEGKDSVPFQDGENGMKPRNSAMPGNSNLVEAEWIEQYEPGVYITLMALQDGTRDLKRVRFRYFIVNLSEAMISKIHLLFAIYHLGPSYIWKYHKTFMFSKNSYDLSFILLMYEITSDKHVVL